MVSMHTFVPGTMMGAEMCVNVAIRGDNEVEKNEIFQVILTATPPDRFPRRRSFVTITILDDGDSE